jgi:chitodextrinase
MLGVVVGLAFADAASAATYDAHLTRAPYLTDLVGVHVIVNFATDQSGTAASVAYGSANGGSCSLTSTQTAARSTVTVGSVSEYQWKASLSLPISGQYCYRPKLGSTDLLGDGASPVFTTQAAAGSPAPFSFAVFGDWGLVDSTGTNSDQQNLLAQLAASGVRFAVTTGDNGYPAGSQTNYGDLQQVGDAMGAIFGANFWPVPGATIPLFTAAGNHGLSGTTHADLTNWPQDQAVSSSGGRYQNDVYCCVNGTTSTNYASSWYAFDAGPARFYVLTSAWGDTNTGNGSVYANDAAAHWSPGTPEYEWLLADLKAHPGGLKFAFSHYPFYSDDKSQGSDTFIQGSGKLEGMLATYGVNIAFNGHSHVYERNRPSAAGYPVTYATGGGGAVLETIGPCSAIDAYGLGWSPNRLAGSACGGAPVPTSASRVFHFLKVTVSGTTVTVAPTDSLGRTFDVQTYSFGSATPDTVIDSGLSPLSNTITGSFSFRSTVDGATFKCSIDGGTPATCTSPWTTPTLADGSHTFTVAATVGSLTDASPASATWTIDATAPTAPVATATASNSSSVGLSWTASTDAGGLAGYDIVRGDTVIATAVTATSYTDSTVAASTTYTYVVRARDTAGNTTDSPSASVTTAAGSTPPDTVIDSGPSALSNTNSGSFSFHSTIGGAAFTCSIDGSTPATCTSPWPTPALADGGHTFAVAAIVGSMTDASPASATWTSDTTAPSAPGSLSATASRPTSIGLTWTASIDAGGVAGYDVLRGGTVIATAVTATSYTDSTAAASTTYTYVVRARDTAGNTTDSAPAGLATPAGTTVPGSASAAVAVKAKAKARPTLSTRPRITGRPRAGRTLICARGTWNGSPARYALTWRRDRRIAGHGSAYRVRGADRGHALRCDVTAANAKGATTAATKTVHVPLQRATPGTVSNGRFFSSRPKQRPRGLTTSDVARIRRHGNRAAEGRL